MMNKYIQIEMTLAGQGRGGFFHAEADFLLDNFNASFCGIGVKIDTGCSISMIPLKRLKVSDALCRTYYDRKGNILIGMDILRDWDIHIGISKITGKNLFLACPSGTMSQEYLDALEYNFGF